MGDPLDWCQKKVVREKKALDWSFFFTCSGHHPTGNIQPILIDPADFNPVDIDWILKKVPPDENGKVTIPQ